ncbi:MAG: DUF4276 family protein [bacterium]
MARKIIFCSESLRDNTQPSKPAEQFSIDAEAILRLFKNNFEALRNNAIESGTIGFEGKKQFMQDLPVVVRNTFAGYRHAAQQLELFVIAVSDSDTGDEAAIENIHKSLAEEIERRISTAEFQRVKIVFAVQAIEAWILADERTLNVQLEQNKAKHENDPEKIDFPKQKLAGLFERCNRKYNTKVLLELLPILNITDLMRCKHFKQLYDCVDEIVNA